MSVSSGHLRLLSAVLALGAAMFFATSAQAKDGTVVVNAPGTDDRSVTVRLATLGAPDINNQDYTLQSGRKTISGYSLARVLRAAEPEAAGWLDLDRIPSVEVDRPSGGPVVISRSQALGQGDRPPVFYENNGTTVFVMPGSPGREYVFRFTPIGIEVGAEAPFDVSLSSSPGRPARRQAVTITAKVSDPPVGATLTYRWSFSDGSAVVTTSSPRIVHRFVGKGPRSVVVTVRSDDGKEAVDALAIDVVDGGGGGGGNPDKGGSGGNSSSGQGSGAAPPATSSAVGSGTGAGSGAGTGAPSASALSAPPPEPSPEQEPPRQQSDGLETVSGELIGPDAQIVEVPPQDFVSEGAGPSELDEGPGLLGGLAGEAATLFGVGLLMALGGLIEIRFLSRRS